MPSPIKHNHFAAALVAVLETSGKKLRHLALDSGIAPGDLSKIRAGKKTATAHNLQHLVDALPGEAGDLLLIAFFKDLVPADRQKFLRRLDSIRDIAKDKPGKQSQFDWSIEILKKLEGHPHMFRAVTSLAETAAWLVEGEDDKKRQV